ncbi:TRAP transporter, DctM subunit [Desulfuromusa kysingii]|uniref:TRAP transporter, DctM subunit n=1 Tax=Desulfuromusa kysingii TaxID=37625 RepID=A0A1H4A099_9BACT|nr:TRAP transporter large permease [Desulfuromusa kysingii]SEA29238.1 TRAP transporter, DctM subunit [Desulfuromusa kysingii]
METLSIVGVFILTLFLGMPIAFVLGITGLVMVLFIDVPLVVLPNRMWSQLGTFPFLAVPFFILAGEIMNEAGITQRLVSFANLLVGRIRGGLGQVNIIASMLFAGITGSAIGDTAALGSIMIPAMEKEGYDKDFSVAVTASSSIIGPIIPPSLLMIILGVAAEQSIGTLFVAGYVPGILIGVSLMILTYFISIKRNYTFRAERTSFRQGLIIFRKALIPLLMPIIIIVGILAGIFTATEAAAVACVYALFVGLFVTKTLKLKRLPDLFIRSALLTASLHLIVSMSGISGFAVTVLQLAEKMSAAVTQFSTNPFVILLLLNIVLLIIGMFMEPTVSIIILVPILFPMIEALGIHPVHFGIIMLMNLTIGVATPPLGLVLFTASSVGKIPVERVVMAIWPFLLIEFVVLLLITYIPALTLTIPRWLGLLA